MWIVDVLREPQLFLALAMVVLSDKVDFMRIGSATEYLNGLVDELRKLPAETPWVEFKENNTNPEDIGEYISALANMAALHGKAAGYLIWGIRDGTHELVGTSFSPSTAKKGNEDLEAWLTRLLSPRVQFKFSESVHNGKTLVVLGTPCAKHSYPVQRGGIYPCRLLPPRTQS